MKACVVLFTMLAAYCSGYSLRVPSAYKHGVKWELRGDTIDEVGKAGSAPAVYKEEATAFFPPEETDYKTDETNPEESIGYGDQKPTTDSHSQQELLPEGFQSDKPLVPGLYEEPTVPQGYGKEVPTKPPTDDHFSITLTAKKVSNPEINALPLATQYYQTAQPVSSLHHVYYVLV